MNDSKIFPRTVVNEIGRRSDWIDLSGWFVGTGTIVASFHPAGTNPWRTDALNMAHNGPASSAQKSRRIQFGILSGPCDLKMLIRLGFHSTETWSIMNSSVKISACGKVVLI